jgi:hypothetical protein
MLKVGVVQLARGRARHIRHTIGRLDNGKLLVVKASYMDHTEVRRSVGYENTFEGIVREVTGIRITIDQCCALEMSDSIEARRLTGIQSSSGVAR